MSVPWCRGRAKLVRVFRTNLIKNNNFTMLYYFIVICMCVCKYNIYIYIYIYIYVHIYIYIFIYIYRYIYIFYIYVYIYGSVFGKRDLLAIFHVMKYDVKCGTCLHK